MALASLTEAEEDGTCSVEALLIGALFLVAPELSLCNRGSSGVSEVGDPLSRRREEEDSVLCLAGLGASASEGELLGSSAVGFRRTFSRSLYSARLTLFEDFSPLVAAPSGLAKTSAGR